MSPVFLPIYNISAIYFISGIFIRSILLSYYFVPIRTLFDVSLSKHAPVRASAYSLLEVIDDVMVALATFIASYCGLYPYKYVWIFALSFSCFHVIALLYYRKKIDIKKIFSH
ncbi:MAG: hypothetical protein HQK51_07860 [Oligoflexia bacterium]|nr:hypothetical protein [Oligoflexia bacterium]